jgi:hypothetical protein
MYAPYAEVEKKSPCHAGVWARTLQSRLARIATAIRTPSAILLYLDLILYPPYVLKGAISRPTPWMSPAPKPVIRKSRSMPLATIIAYLRVRKQGFLWRIEGELAYTPILW